jgi:hypothetical protein
LRPYATSFGKWLWQQSSRTDQIGQLARECQSRECCVQSYRYEHGFDRYDRELGHLWLRPHFIAQHAKDIPPGLYILVSQAWRAATGSTKVR